MRDKAIALMEEYFADQGYVDHALAVTSFAEEIAAAEGVKDDFRQQVITLAGIFHDVGIPAAIKIHGSGAGPYQEREGEPIAREMLERLGVRPDIRERVCYLVGHHHSPEFIDGLDFRILFEADAMVNIPNRKARGQLVSREDLEKLVAPTFRTEAGRALIEAWAATQSWE